MRIIAGGKPDLTDADVIVIWSASVSAWAK